MLGPLYHRQAAADRAEALQEAWRILKPGGVLVAAAMSRRGRVFWSRPLTGCSPIRSGTSCRGNRRVPVRACRIQGTGSDAPWCGFYLFSQAPVDMAREGSAVCVAGRLTRQRGYRDVRRPSPRPNWNRCKGLVQRPDMYGTTAVNRRGRTPAGHKRHQTRCTRPGAGVRPHRLSHLRRTPRRDRAVCQHWWSLDDTTLCGCEKGTTVRFGRCASIR
jgi:SAM-dependent methyltransferase